MAGYAGTAVLSSNRLLRWFAWLGRKGLSTPLANPEHVPPVLFTIGYERHPEPGSLVSALQAAGVERLVDVRELPMSRRKGFSKTGLAKTLADAGLAYEHERALGNPKPYRDLYRSGQETEGARRYRAHLSNGSAWAVDALADSLGATSTCLLCFEHNHGECHRAVIVEELHARLPGLRVRHL
jgi:uncharacterized protein (DUF488 family)